MGGTFRVDYSDQSEGTAAATPAQLPMPQPHRTTRQRPRRQKQTQNTCRHRRDTRAYSLLRGRIAPASHATAARCYAKTPPVSSGSGEVDDIAQAPGLARSFARLAPLSQI